MTRKDLKMASAHFEDASRTFEAVRSTFKTFCFTFSLIPSAKSIICTCLNSTNCDHRDH